VLAELFLPGYRPAITPDLSSEALYSKRAPKNQLYVPEVLRICRLTPSPAASRTNLPELEVGGTKPNEVIFSE
jgi:hypothetical protein